MGIEEIAAADILPSDEAIERAGQKVAALQSMRYFEHRLELLREFYQGEAARIQGKIDESRRVYRRLSGRAGVPA